MMKKTITAITAQNRDGKRCNVFLDGEFFSGIQLITVMKNRLKVGMVIAEEELNEIVASSEREVAMQKALGYVGKYMRTKAQVAGYLKKKGFLKETVDSVIGKLQEYGYVNDFAYSDGYLKERNLVKGKRLMAYELKLKGVDERTIDEALSEAPDEEEGAYRTARKFLKDKILDFETIGKCYRRLISRGFDYDVVKSVIERIKKENENFED